jgi:hypothetical protein
MQFCRSFAQLKQRTATVTVYASGNLFTGRPTIFSPNKLQRARIISKILKNALKILMHDKRFTCNKLYYSPDQIDLCDK